MDEMTEIRTLLPEQAPPSRAVVAAARARLLAEGEAPVRRARRLPTIGIAVAAAAAAAAVAVVALPSQEAPAPDQQVLTEPSARDVLLVAAEQAEADAGRTGRFWHVRTVSGSQVGLRPVGTAPDTYELERRVVTESWASLDGSEPDWHGSRDLGVRPATPADEEAWRRDGSPTSWNLGYDAELERDNVVTTAPAEGTLFERSPLAQVVPGLTAREVRDLPTDAAALRAFLESNRTPRPDEPTDPEGRRQLVDHYLFTRATMLIAETPAPPAVRAAALRLIADLGGVTSTGTVTDALGREGTGITLVWRSGAGTDTVELVIDQKTGTLLGSRHTGAEGEKVLKTSYSAVLSSDWTDAAPAVPSADVP